MDTTTDPLAKRIKPNPEDDSNLERPTSFPESSMAFISLNGMPEQQQRQEEDDNPTAIAAAVVAATTSPSRATEGSSVLHVERFAQYHSQQHSQDHLAHVSYSNATGSHHPNMPFSSSVSEVVGGHVVVPIDGGEEATAMAAAAAAVPIPGDMGLLQDDASNLNESVNQNVMVPTMNLHPIALYHAYYPQTEQHSQLEMKQEVEEGAYHPHELQQHPPHHEQHQQQQEQGGKEASHPTMPPLISGSNISMPMPSMTHILPSSDDHDHNGIYLEDSRPSHTLTSTDPAYRRKDKSLGVLCANFMRRYSRMHTESPGESIEVTIDEASQSLLVERRRIYDIINILEAIEVVTRKGKNTYNWHGLSNITNTLRKLQQEALELFPDDVVQNQLEKDGQKDSRQSAEPTGFDLLLASAEQVEKPLKKGKEKSLGRLSQKFIMLFLAGNETITLEDASDKILGKTELPQAPADATAEEMLKIRNANNKMIKTKIRRLYDIANIMASVGLITKLHSESQAVGSAPRAKPIFKWIYPLSARDIMTQVDPNAEQQQQQQQQQQSAEDTFLGHPGVGDIKGVVTKNDVIENPVAFHQQQDHYSYPQQYQNRHHEKEQQQYDHYNHNDHNHNQQQQHHLHSTNSDNNGTCDETNELAEDDDTNAMKRNAALIANSVANANDSMHDIDAAAAAEAAVVAFEQGNLEGESEKVYAGDEGECDERVGMEENESIAV
eukprot:CAMPEP_0176478970 /NCGR_PEP_ID=MMETSP0200_2-20121128/1480_1 /TAXON_ID=947934 /ORGANISM="Chaetoceros sp., Strain GSL56" /LENGTH=721 /DNA_ID=CAMNT_0017874963 /DNA_START=499 /DNA_END=2664 /DNA_ORIENTATION=-